ncbi:MAG TPA: CoA transferase [Hyphomicrobiaceae bacterium]|nr:CoA transferase [Hyphomicrobiaceae bacterium]
MKPLQGIRVLTFEQFGAGPYSTLLLADLGADVIKIENPAAGGDAARHVGPHMLSRGQSHYYQTWNMNKRSVALDIKSADGRAAFERLVQTADAVVNNLRGDQPGKLRLDYASLRPLNARIVCLHISAYGRDNSRKNWPGYDFLMQAEAGLMSLTGEPDHPPARVGVSMVDYMTGATGAVGLLSCILRARQTGIGCDVDASLFDVALHQLGYAAVWYLNEEDVSRRQPRSAHAAVAPVQTFPTADGWIFVMCMTDKFWVNFVTAIGRADLADDPRFSSQAVRREHREALTQVLDAEMRRRTTGDWLQAFSGLLPAGPVLDMDQALNSPFVAEVGMVRSVPHPARGDLKVLANPLKIDGERPAQAAARDLGADSEAVLAEVAAPTLPVRVRA